MASAYKRGDRWWGSWKGPDGKRVRKPLPGVTTKREAEQIANAHEAHATRVKAGLDSALDNSAEIAPLVEGFLLHKMATASYQTARHFCAALAATVGQYRTDEGLVWPPRQYESFDQVRGMSRTFYPGELGVEAVGEITQERMEQYVERHHQRLKVRTLNARVNSLKALLEWARKGGRIASNPLAEMSRVGVPDRDMRYLTQEQVHKLLVAAPEPERTVWMAFIHTGLRKTELTSLRWSAVTFKPTPGFPHGFIRVLAGTSKGRRQREVPLTPELRERLTALRLGAEDPERGHVFVNSKGNPLGYNLSRKLRRALKRAGLPEDAVPVHGLRHTFATGLLLSGANVITVSKLMGHRNVTQTLNTYAHVCPERLQEAMDLLPFGDTTESQPERSPAQVVA